MSIGHKLLVNVFVFLMLATGMIAQEVGMALHNYDTPDRHFLSDL